MSREQREPYIALAIGLIFLMHVIVLGCYIIELYRYHPEPMVQVLIEYEGPWNASVTLSTGEKYSHNDTGRGTFICYLDYGEEVDVCTRKMDDSINFLNVTLKSVIGESKIVKTGSTKEPHGVVLLEYKQK